MSVFVPYLFAFVAIGCYASLPPLAKKMMLGQVPPFAFIGITMAILSALSFSACFAVEKKFSFQSLGWSEWKGLVFFAFVNFLGFTLYLFAIKNIAVAHYQIIGLITPLIGGLLAYFILREPFYGKYLISILFMGIGLYFALFK